MLSTNVVVTTNQFGDILTDLGARVSSVAWDSAPGLCIGVRQAMAQATHGSTGYRRAQYRETLTR